MTKPHIKYRVALTGEERDFLEKLIQKANTADYRIRHAHIPLAPDEIPGNASWTDEKIGSAFRSHASTVGNIRKRFVEEGFEAAPERKQRKTPPRIR